MDIHEIINDLDRGKFGQRLTQAIIQTAAKVRENGGKGVVTVKFNMALDSERTLMIAPQLEAKAPTPQSRPSIFFLTDDGGLSREDPDQPDLPGVVSISKISNN